MNMAMRILTAIRLAILMTSHTAMTIPRVSITTNMEIACPVRAAWGTGSSAEWSSVWLPVSWGW